MTITALKKFTGSIFTKLLVAALIAGLLIDIMVGWALHSFKQRAIDSYDQTLIQYVDYLVADLGDPPDVARARSIARRTSLIIRYESPEANWITAENPPEIPAEVHRMWLNDNRIKAGVYRGHHFIRVGLQQGRLTFIAARPPWVKEKIVFFILALCGVLSAIMAGAYFYLRWILKPVRWLMTGVHEVGGGHLGHRVPERRSDEFRELAEAFNKMTGRIDGMLKAKEQLLLDISHELRSPVTRLKLGLEFLPAGPTRESLREDIGEVERLISQILESARTRNAAMALDLQPLDLADLVRSVVDDFQGRSPGIEPGPLPGAMVTVDAEKMRIVLKNVLENAIKYSADSARRVAISLSRDGSKTIVTIRDHGEGIPEESQPYLFEPFFRVDSSRSRETGGYGLGLSLCQTIMTAHGGTIGIESRFGKGTIVTLTLIDRS
jgi:signal transduction histidine kinase